MKTIYFSLLILFIVLILVSSVILAKPNNNLNVLLYSEDKEDTATHLKFYASDEIAANKRIIYSIIVTASVPSPLGQGNVIDQGLVALVIPETAEVDYQNIKVYGAPIPESNKYVEYQPESKSTKELFDILGLIISKIPVLGLVMDLSPIYQARTRDYGGFIDLNQYDIVKVNWEAPRLKYWQKVQIDIPVHSGDDAEIGLYAYWQSRASSTDGSGPIHARDNIVDVGFNISKEKIKKEVILNGQKIAWQRILGSSDSECACSITQTNDDGYAVAGYNLLTKIYWIIKMDNLGKIIWKKNIKRNFQLINTDMNIIQTNDGGYVVAGCSANSRGSSDFWIIKMDNQGNIVWDKTLGGERYDEEISIIQTNDGGYAVAGSIRGNRTVWEDLWIIKLDSQGKTLWDKTFGGPHYERAHSIIQTNDGGYAVAGSIAGNAGWSDICFVKLDNQGNKIWDKIFGRKYFDEAHSIIQTSDDGYAIAGYTKSKGAGERDAWLIKLDRQGDIIFEKNYGGSEDDEFFSIIHTIDDGYALAGYTKSYGAGGKDVWIIKLDSKGNITWDKTFGRSKDDVAYSIIQTSEKGYVLVGKITSEGFGDTDALIIKLDSEGN